VAGFARDAQSRWRIAPLSTRGGCPTRRMSASAAAGLLIHAEQRVENRARAPYLLGLASFRRFGSLRRDEARLRRFRSAAPSRSLSTLRPKRSGGISSNQATIVRKSISNHVMPSIMAASSGRKRREKTRPAQGASGLWVVDSTCMKGNFMHLFRVLVLDKLKAGVVGLRQRVGQDIAKGNGRRADSHEPTPNKWKTSKRKF
jgi:hypothetical protein